MTFAELLKTFQHQKLVKVEPGQHSKRVLLIGKHGENKIIEVPLGCECVNEGNSILLARCNTPNRRYLVASGGRGGCAENGYVGERGETVHVSLHLKLRPNIGLVGFPNAGKSTLLKAFVPEKPVKIANYPFTTTKPQLCYVKYEDTKVIEENFENMEKNLSTKLEPFSLSVADLPGLIEGASQNRGCGHAFLKHMEYSEILVIVIDVFGFQLAPDHRLPYRSAIETLALLNKELEAYDLALLSKPAVVALNKIDMHGGKEKAEELKELLSSENWTTHVSEEMRPRVPLKLKSVVSISAKKQEIGNLKKILKDIYEENHPIKHLYTSEFDNTGHKSLV
uniref:OBG-type G domain-containing protein n=1 Tax=Acrobeloides nanus TaxID=290746 RepID=A0A914BX37_9BILA